MSLLSTHPPTPHTTVYVTKKYPFDKHGPQRRPQLMKVYSVKRNTITTTMPNLIRWMYLLTLLFPDSIQGFSIFHKPTTTTTSYQGYTVRLSDEGNENRLKLLVQSSMDNNWNNMDVDDYYEEDESILLPPMDLPADEESIINAKYQRDELQQMTVAQLKQQLRLRGMTVSGRKAELVERLYVGLVGRATILEEEEEEKESLQEPEFLSAEEMVAEKVRRTTDKKKKTNNGTEIAVNVTAYLNEEDQNKEFKTASFSPTSSTTVDDDDDISDEKGSTTEVWGTQARLGLSDENEKRPIVDGLSRIVVEFQGSNQTYVSARVIATRDAFKPSLQGNRTMATEAELRRIQMRREKESSRPLRQEDTVGLDEGDETGIFTNILDREFSDWGKYTATGAQLSAQEVQGVLLLTDVYGAYVEDVTVLAEKIAFECQPVVVMIPDLFRGQPWTGPTNGVNEKGKLYEEWREIHNELRVNVDIRAAAACLREMYCVNSVVVWGMCYGGGRALEAAAGWFQSVYDVDGVTVGPPPVDPTVVVAWYPTRYNAMDLFGHANKVQMTTPNRNLKRTAVMAIFAEDDTIPGATPQDAATLKRLLEEDDRVIDHMVKVFPGQKHGFAHIGLWQSQQESDENQDDLERFVDEEFGGTGRLKFAEGDAEVACLLSTAFMETYSRIFLPTVGPPISLDEREQEWGKELTMKDLESTRQRDIRAEIKDSIENFVEEPLQSGPRIDPLDPSQEEELMKLLRSMESPNQKGPFKIADDDDLATIYGKLTAADENFEIF